MALGGDGVSWEPVDVLMSTAGAPGVITVIGATPIARIGAIRVADADLEKNDEPNDCERLVPPNPRRDIWITELEVKP